ncbi:GntR family transcriptional regulator [Cumulibacter soli]|uniref:GntR family transcriptional regulator n=1 Tax=Cumulibacter soli TaxID=2546344 RepID=UPI0010687ACE|nr:GntR family transcriptional regulator [Cumulibacter soli]
MADASASDRAYRVIRNRIIEHAYEPGTMLGESTLAGEIGMSRTPVRTALARLQDEGWIAVYPKRGAQVRGVSQRAAAELADARIVLESTSVDRASSPRRAELADRLEESIEAQRVAFADGDVAQFIDLTLSFHRSFVEVGENRVLLELYDRLVDRHRFLLFGSGERLLSRCADIIDEHHLLLDEVRHGDGPGFAKALRNHIAETSATDVDGFGDVVGR